MRYLLDTSTFLWFVSDYARLSANARRPLEDAGNTIHLSVVSIWEIAVKSNTGKLQLPLPFDAFIDTAIPGNSLSVLNIEIAHIRLLASMPLHHRDPFDRLLIAQSQVEDIPILTSDAAFDRYPVQRVW